MMVESYVGAGSRRSRMRLSRLLWMRRRMRTHHHPQRSRPSSQRRRSEAEECANEVHLMCMLSRTLSGCAGAACRHWELQHFVEHVWFVFSRHVPEFEDSVSIGMSWTHSHHLCMYSTRCQNLRAVTPSDIYTAPSPTCLMTAEATV